MPFTPFHLGPGLLFKAVGWCHFSFMVFGGSQVLMDLEPLIGIIRGSAVLHGYTHTLLGALLIGTIAGLIGRPISLFFLRLHSVPHHPFTWTASFVGAYIGTFSHVGLDALMHADMNPWWPFVAGNPLLGTVTIGWLHLGCLAAGVLGCVIIAIRFRLQGIPRWNS